MNTHDDITVYRRIRYWNMRT